MRTSFQHHLSMRRSQLVNLGLVLVACCWLAFLWTQLTPEVDDFRQYWQAAVNIWQTGDAYATTGPQFATLPEAQRPPAYPNPPLLAYLVLPLAYLSQQVAQHVWFLFNCGLAVALVAIAITLCQAPSVRRWYGAVILLMLVAPPTRLCLQLGQLGLLLAVLLLAGVLVAQRHPRVAGLLLALGGLIKLYPGLMLVYYLLLRQRAVVVWTALCGLGLLFGSLALHGFAPYRAYAERVLFAGYYPYAAEFNISLFGFWRRLLVPSDYGIAVANLPQLASGLIAVCTIALLTICTRVTYRVRAAALELPVFCLWLCAMLILSPVNGYYNLVTLLVPVLVVLHRLEQQPQRAQRNWLIIALLLINIPPTWSDFSLPLYNFVHIGWGLLLLTPSFYGVLMLFGLLAIQSTQMSAKP